MRDAKLEAAIDLVIEMYRPALIALGDKPMRVKVPHKFEPCRPGEDLCWLCGRPKKSLKHKLEAKP